MRLHRLILENFRGFEKLEVDFAPDGGRPIVLVGVNGAGKSSILDAIALMLLRFAEGVRTGNPDAIESLVDNDLRVGAPSCKITLTAAFPGFDDGITWTVAKGRPGHVMAVATESASLQEVIDSVRRTIGEGAPCLPLAVHYPTNRSALDIPARIRTPHEFTALSAYEGALQGTASDFRGFFEWFREEEDIYNEQLALQWSPEQVAAERPALSHVRRAIEAFFPGSRGLRIERRPQKMTLEHRGVRLDVTQLSDGEKCLLAMIGDLARRMVLVAPQLSDPLQQRAVVLIDEIELHLHPALQRTILPRLRGVFPNTQFVVSTHSPQLLSSVTSQSVRLLEDFQSKPLERGTWRRDTNRILEAVFGDPGRPLEVAGKLQALKMAVDDDRVAEARALLRELHELMKDEGTGLTDGQDPEIFFYEQLLPPEGDEGAP